MNQYTERPRSSNVWIGLIILTIGVVFLFKRMDLFFFPHWLFRWPMILIGIGLIIGVRHRFQGPGWLIIFLIGVFFMINEIGIYHWYLWHYGPAIAIIILGAFLIFRSTSFRSRDPFLSSEATSEYSWSDQNVGNTTTEEQSKDNASSPTADGRTSWSGEDYIDMVSVFGGHKKKVFSKNFKGGEATSFFGGTTLDLTQADVNGIAKIDVVQVFGGVKLIVPSNWYVSSDMVSIFGGLEDKRIIQSSLDPTKHLKISGVCIFGGVEIKSY